MLGAVGHFNHRLQRRSVLASRTRFSKPRGLLVGGLMAVIGLVVVARIIAAGSFVAVEPENGTLASGAAAVSDATASAGKAVKFATGTSPIGWPNANNTGLLVATT